MPDIEDANDTVAGLRRKLNQLRYDLGTACGASHWGSQKSGGPDATQNAEIVAHVRQLALDGTSRTQEIQQLERLAAKHGFPPALPKEVIVHDRPEYV